MSSERNGSIRNVAVFCGSSHGEAPAYAAAAQHLGETLAARGLGLVYGGGVVGLMGIVADAVLAGGAEVYGVIPRSLARAEVEHPDLTELVVVDDLFDRKRLMMERADAFVSLPGGVGTLDEMFEVLTWVQLGEMSKPSGLLDVDGFYDGLCAYLDGLVEARFLRPVHRELLLHGTDADDLLDRLARWAPNTTGKSTGKWIDP